jgi:thioredoxin reductase (NADPH)
MPENEKAYDLIIVGAGPAGMTASIYASRYKIKHLVIGSEIGGQAVNAVNIENWPGIESIPGAELMKNFRAHAEKLGGEFFQSSVDKINKKDGYFEVMCEDVKKNFNGKIILFALGMRPRKMEIPGEDRLAGKGVAYCATCDAMFYKNKDVAVIGGGDSAATAALHLSEFANKVYLVYRDGDVKIEPTWMEKIEQNQKIEKVPMNAVSEIKGEEKVEGLAFEFNGEKKEISVQGVFIEIGAVPGVGIAKELGVKVNEQEYIIVNQDQSTNVENVYAAGDVTTESNGFRQIITASSEGALAAESIYKKLKLEKEK